ncbi:unnamed protein product [Clonostachys rhizophaga]|uniref:Uncharacterized protein n=1 Tax=Clonostachys rhizophaga TaxID=160324 RepID=A0A9N9YME2_9HYPO|nr:unnamed protein product [Clonostachys rhizophaga]
MASVLCIYTPVVCAERAASGRASSWRLAMLTLAKFKSIVEEYSSSESDREYIIGPRGVRRAGSPTWKFYWGISTYIILYREAAV